MVPDLWKCFPLDHWLHEDKAQWRSRWSSVGLLSRILHLCGKEQVNSIPFPLSLTRNVCHGYLPDYTCTHYILFAKFWKSFFGVVKNCPFVLSIITAYFFGTGTFAYPITTRNNRLPGMDFSVHNRVPDESVKFGPIRNS